MGQLTKRLLIKASNDYEKGFRVVPVNTGVPIEIESDIGVFSLKINIRSFDGSTKHQGNSKYNLPDDKYLDGTSVDGESVQTTGESNEAIPNLRMEVQFRPRAPIRGSELLFGNDFTAPIKEHVPTSLLYTGLKFFNWFINSSVKGDVYNDKPYLYGLALSSFSYISIKNSNTPKKGTEEASGGPVASTATSGRTTENLNSNIDNLLNIPVESLKRKSFFNKLSNCESFVFNEGSDYLLRFDTSSIKLADSKYAVSIPTYGNKTLDIDVSSYANDKLNNFNWILKEGGYEGVGHGKLGLVVNFALINETS